MIFNIVFSSQSDLIYYIKWALSILNHYALYKDWQKQTEYVLKYLRNLYRILLKIQNTHMKTSKRQYGIIWIIYVA